MPRDDKLRYAEEWIRRQEQLGLEERLGWGEGEAVKAQRQSML